jgi:exodeoxyribonuclease VII large subunit
MSQLELGFEPQRELFTVTSLTSEIRALLRGRYEDIHVAGEISGVKVAQSGHCYFTLKEAGAQLRSVLYRQTLRYLKFRPQDGLAVVARGALDVWDARGEYQLVVSGLEPQGVGALQLAFEQLKRQLEAEGLFDPARKRPLPRFPRRVGIVTSPTGAVIRDMLNVLGRRFPGLHVRLYPTLVQGDGAAAAIAAGIEYFSAGGWADVVIAGRGGGSLEDLWAFNEEVVARAIAACAVPVVSAVGHETDFTIADFAADLRAPTPSAAAELVAPNQAEVLAQVEAHAVRAGRAMRLKLAQAGRRLEDRGVTRAAGLLARRIGRSLQRLDDAHARMREALRAKAARGRQRWNDLDGRVRRHDPRLRLAALARRLASASQAAAASIALRLAAARGRIAPLEAQLAALSPLGVLERGYAIVQDAAGAVIRRAAQAPAGTELRVRLSEGRLKARVEE